MITQIRRGLKSRGFRVAVWVFIVILAGGFVFLQFFINMFRSPKWAFKVNGSTVTAQQFERKTLLEDEYISTIKSHLGPQAEMYLQLYGITQNPQELAKSQLIRESLLDQQVKKINFTLDPDYVTQKVNDPSFVSSYLVDVIPVSAFVPGQGIDPARLYTELKRLNLTESDFEQAIEHAIKRSVFLNQLLAPAAYLPEFAKEHEYQMMFGPRKVSFSMIKYDDVLAQEKQKTIADEELQSFYEREARKQRYRVPEKRDGKMWRFDSGDYNLTVSDKRIEDYYNKNKSNFIKDRAQIQVRHILLKTDEATDDHARKKAEELHAQLQPDPSLFEELARKHSQDDKSASKGGLLPYFSRGALNNVPFEKAAFLLSKDGQISPIVKTTEGYEIIQRVGRKPQVYTPLIEVKDDISHRLTQKKFEQQFIGDIRSMLKRRKIDEDQWKEFIKRKLPQVQQLTNIEQGHSNLKLAQALSKLKEGEYGVYLDGQIGVVVRLDKIKKAHTPSLEDIKDQVLEDRYAYRATKELEAQLKEIHYDSLKQPFEEVASQKGFSVSALAIDPTDRKLLKEVEDQGLPLQKMLQLENKGGVARVMVGKDGYVMRLDDLQPIDLDGIEEQKKKELAQRMIQETISYLTNGYIASLYRDATLKINNSLVQSSG